MNDKEVAFVFPGQGSQFLGMGQSLAQAYPAARELFNQADDLLEFSLSQITWDGPIESLNDTVNTQPALFTHSIAALQVLRSLETDLRPSFVAGHSMGEITALVAAGAMTFNEGLKLVRKRGELMKHAGELNPGGMAAVLGLEIPVIEQICLQASSTSEIAQVANDNCPGQVVISGSNTTLERVQPLLEAAGARRVIRLPVSIAAHSPLMSSAQEEFNRAVAATNINAPFIPLIGNVTANLISHPDDIKEELQNQLTHRVRWTETIRRLISLGVSEFIEIGSGSVLSGLIKRIDPYTPTSTLGTPEDFRRLARG